MKPRAFATPADFRAWLEKRHATETELLMRLYKTHARSKGIGYREALDEALCFGWIDGLRRGVDAEHYTIRFSPRKPTSKWSRVNLRRFAELDAEGLVHDAGRAARAKWDDSKQAGYSHEAGLVELDAVSRRQLEANPKAWRFWQAQIPSYRKMVAGWLRSPKREQTRVSRLATLIDCCTRGKAIPPVAKWVKMKQPG
jgi:uncharacterized protein YdeI (YjbR/CyaY-like superfamily)